MWITERLYGLTTNKMHIKQFVINWFLSTEVEKVEHPVILVDDREYFKKGGFAEFFFGWSEIYFCLI